MTGATISETRGVSLAGIVALLMLVLVGVYAFPYWPTGYAGTTYIGLHILGTLAMILAWATPRIGVSNLFLLAVFLRLALLPAAPITSNDMERYLWDGAVALSGFDPYSVAPDNPMVSDLRARWPTPEEHAAYPTLYPPAALALFAVSALAGPSIGLIVWKGIATAAGIVSVFVMKAALEQYGQQRHFALFALSPLLLLETGIGAHLDSLLVLGVSLVVLLYARKQWLWLGVALGWITCVKFLPLALLAPLFVALGWRNFCSVLAGCLATIAVFYGGALALGYIPVGVLPTFFEKWRFTSPLFELLVVGFGEARVWIPMVILAVLGVVGSCVLARRDLALGFAAVLSVPLLLSPVVFPWYLMILVPFLAVRPNRTLLLWVSLAPMSYIVLNRWLGEGVWEPSVWPSVAIGLALVLGFLWDAQRAWPVREFELRPTANQ